MKKLVSVIFAIVLISTLVASLGVTAAAENTAVEVIGITGFAAPTVGASVAENVAAIQPAGEGYSISAAWYALGDAEIGETFGESSYFLRVAITPNEGYDIAADAAFSINGDTESSYIDSNSAVFENGTACLDTVYIVATTPSVEPTLLDEINVEGFAAPVAGADIAENLAALSVPEGANYSISAAFWFDNNTNENVTEGTFQAGNKYFLEVYVELDEGYAFADTVALLLNGTTDAVDMDYANTTGDDSAYIATIDYNVVNYIRLIEISGLIAPTIGADIAENLANLSIPDGALYSVKSMGWNSGTGDPLTEGKFEAGKTYYLCVEIIPADNCEFDHRVVVTINGDTDYCHPDFGSVEPTSVAAFSIPYALPTVLDTIRVSGIDDPIVGETVAQYRNRIIFVVPSDSHYNVSAISWHEYDPETGTPIKKLQHDDVFEAGSFYAAQIDISAGEKYIFAEDAEVILNGGELEVAEALSSDSSCTAVAVFSTVPETGDGSATAIFIIGALATVCCIAVAIHKKKEN